MIRCPLCYPYWAMQPYAVSCRNRDRRIIDVRAVPPTELAVRRADCRAAGSIFRARAHCWRDARCSAHTVVSHVADSRVLFTHGAHWSQRSSLISISSRVRDSDRLLRRTAKPAVSSQRGCLAFRRLTLDGPGGRVEVAAAAGDEALPQRQVLGVHGATMVLLGPAASYISRIS